MKKLFLAIALIAMALCLSSASIVVASNSFPMDIQVIVEDDADAVAKVVALGKEGYDFIYQSGIMDREDGKLALAFVLHSQEELNYFNASGLNFEIIVPEPVLQPLSTATSLLADNSAYWYEVRDADGFIVGIPGGGSRNINPGYLMREKILDGTDVFDPTGVTFNATYGFPNRAGYRTVEEYYGEMFYLAKTYPHLAKIHKIGNSWYYPTYSLEICNAPGVEDGRPEWLSLAAQHAREWPANELVMNNAWWLVTQYDKYIKGDNTVEPKIIEVMENIRTWSTPMYNPDGTWYDQSGVSAGTNRSNRRPGPNYVSTATNEILQDYRAGGSFDAGRFYDTSNTAGSANYPVDLNRNFAYRWGSGDGSSNPSPGQGGGTTRGFFPVSEPENQAISALVARRMIMSDYSGHTYGGLVIYPWDNKKSLAITDNMNFEDLGRILARFNNYNDYHERVIYSQSGEGQGFMYGSFRSLGFTYEMGYNYQSNSAINFVPPYNGAANTFKVAVGNFKDRNPSLTINGLNGSVNGSSGPGVTSDVPKGTLVAPVRYTTAANTGSIQTEVTAPVVVMMPECVVNVNNYTNCRRDVLGNILPTGQCHYHTAFQTTYTTTDLLATPARFNQMLTADSNFVRGKILLCYVGANAADNTTIVERARDAGAVAVIFAQCGTGNNANSAHTFTGAAAMNAISGDAIPVAHMPRPYARTVHDNIKEMAAVGEVATLTLKTDFYNWNTQMMEWERNCYSFLELASFAKEYAGVITGQVVGGDGNVVPGARLDISLEVKAPVLRPEFSSDTFHWDKSILTTTTANNIHSQVERIGSKITEYVHPTTGDTINVTKWMHTSYIDKFGADGSFKWSVNPSTQFDAYMFEGLRQPAAGGSGNTSTRGYAGGFEASSSTDPRIGTLLFPNDGYTVKANAPGYYSDEKQVVVEDYKVTVNNANFKIAEAIKAEIDAGSFFSDKGENKIAFSTFVLDETTMTSTKGVIAGATVFATVNGIPAQVVSLNNGDYELVFKADEHGLVHTDEAELIIDFTGGPAHSAYVNTIVIGLATEAPGINGPTSMTLTEGYTATDTGTYTITGNPTPTVTKTSGNAAIMWNDATKRLDIAAGLAVGKYTVVLTASNGISPDATLIFVLTVATDDSIGCNAIYGLFAFALLGIVTFTMRKR